MIKRSWCVAFLWLALAILNVWVASAERTMIVQVSGDESDGDSKGLEPAETLEESTDEERDAETSKDTEDQESEDDDDEEEEDSADDSSSECVEEFTRDYDPVCGSNGEKYDNLSIFTYYQCLQREKDGTEITIVDMSKCE